MPASEDRDLAGLQQHLTAALSELKTALDLTFAFGNGGEARKRLAAREWERVAREFLTHAQQRSREEKQNLLAWLSMIRLT